MSDELDVLTRLADYPTTSPHRGSPWPTTYAAAADASPRRRTLADW